MCVWRRQNPLLCQKLHGIDPVATHLHSHIALTQEGAPPKGGTKAEDSNLGNSVREYEALMSEVKILRQAVDSRYALHARLCCHQHMLHEDSDRKETTGIDDRNCASVQRVYMLLQPMTGIFTRPPTILTERPCHSFLCCRSCCTSRGIQHTAMLCQCLPVLQCI